MTNKFDDMFEVPPALQKAIGHVTGAFGVMFFGVGFYFLIVMIIRIFKLNFESIGFGVGFTVVVLGIGCALLYTAKKILDEVK